MDLWYCEVMTTEGWAGYFTDGPPRGLSECDEPALAGEVLVRRVRRIGPRLDYALKCAVRHEFWGSTSIPQDRGVIDAIDLRVLN